MEFSARVAVLNSTPFQVFEVHAESNKLAKLGKPFTRNPGKSIIGLRSYKVLNTNNTELSFKADDIEIYNLGDSDRCIAVALGKEDGRASKAEQAMSNDDLAGCLTGDTAFIDACREEKLPANIILLGQKFLNGVREFSNDQLREGKNRKWVFYPNNFVAITIQNRNKQYCIHVRTTEILSQLRNYIDVRNDRPGYSRFWLSDISQLGAAIGAAKSSFEAR